MKRTIPARITRSSLNMFLGCFCLFCLFLADLIVFSSFFGVPCCCYTTSTVIESQWLFIVIRYIFSASRDERVGSEWAVSGCAAGWGQLRNCCLLGGHKEQHLRQPRTRTRNHAPPAFLYYVLKIDNQFLVRRFFDKYAFTAQKLRTNKRFLEISTSKSCFRLFGDLKFTD